MTGGREEVFRLEGKRGRSFVGRANDAAKDRGWFFGHFMDEQLLQSDSVEVAWQHVPNLTPSPDQRHIHRRSVEINVVLRGKVSLKLDDVQHHLREGEFYVVLARVGCERNSDRQRGGGARRSGAKRSRRQVPASLVEERTAGWASAPE